MATQGQVPPQIAGMKAPIGVLPKLMARSCAGAHLGGSPPPDPCTMGIRSPWRLPFTGVDCQDFDDVGVARRVVVTGRGWRGYCGVMRYPDGGGLTAAGRARREKVRLQAAEWFAEGIEPPEVARRLRVSCNSAYAWRRRWRDGGTAALASRGPGGAACRLDGGQLGLLRAALEAGPATWG